MDKVLMHGLGCRLAAQAALVELVEEQGLPPVCAALAVEEDGDVPLGRVLAQAVQVRAFPILLVSDCRLSETPHGHSVANVLAYEMLMHQNCEENVLSPGTKNKAQPAQEHLGGAGPGEAGQGRPRH